MDFATRIRVIGNKSGAIGYKPVEKNAQSVRIWAMEEGLTLLF